MGDANFAYEADLYVIKHASAPEVEQYIYAALKLYGNAITITKLEKNATQSIPVNLDGRNIISSPCPE